jgi:hypothetical protein
LAEKAGGQELMDLYILWGASSGEIGKQRNRTKYIRRRALNVQTPRHFKEGGIVRSLDFISFIFLDFKKITPRTRADRQRFVRHGEELYIRWSSLVGKL